MKLPGIFRELFYYRFDSAVKPFPEVGRTIDAHNSIEFIVCLRFKFELNPSAVKSGSRIFKTFYVLSVHASENINKPETIIEYCLIFLINSFDFIRSSLFQLFNNEAVLHNHNNITEV